MTAVGLASVISSAVIAILAILTPYLGGGSDDYDD